MSRLLVATSLMAVVLATPTSFANPSSITEVKDGALRVGSCDLERTYHQTFGNSFTITPHRVVGPSWIAHTPWNGDFGDALFVDPRPGFPFSIDKGMLTIEARKIDNRWYSGLIASADGSAKGFAQMHGYFETRAKLPPGKGLWPAIWLGEAKPVTLHVPGVEIDVIEHYGQFPDKFNSVVHTWAAEGGKHVRPSPFHIQDVAKGSLYNQFHSYGVDVEPDWITFYFDRKEYWRAETPPELKYPMMILIDLALGGGWPIEEAPSPSIMTIDYVDVYRRAPSCKTP